MKEHHATTRCFVELEKPFEEQQISGGGGAAHWFFEAEAFAFSKTDGDGSAHQPNGKIDAPDSSGRTFEETPPFDGQEFKGGLRNPSSRAGLFGNELESGSVNERQIFTDESLEISAARSEGRIMPEFFYRTGARWANFRWRGVVHWAWPNVAGGGKQLKVTS
jgi:hypothetical protein